ncbi:unnamed protein product [Trichobilharzia regenti]|nr:unnamed protein product [Trichobilharzia regenti]
MFSSSSDKLHDSLIQLRALTSGNVECGRIYAENAVRKQKESLNYLRMASRFDAVQSRVQTALTMNQNIGSVSNELEKAMRSMDLEKLEKVMSKFESQFEDLDVRSATIENSMKNTFTLSAPEQEINALIKQVSWSELFLIAISLRHLHVNPSLNA